jgi:membrane glycosyltransferase
LTGAGVFRRRLAFAALGFVLWAMLMLACVATIGWGSLAFLLALLLPWVALGAANALLGLGLLLSREPLVKVLPAAAMTRQGAPAGRTAIGVCIRHEEMGRVLPPLALLLDGLHAAGVAERFELWFLSDSSDAAHAAAEDRAIAAFRAARPEDADRIHHRRRAENTGFKAGNVMEFMDRHSNGIDHLLCLDADSQMSAAAVLRLVAIMEAGPRIAILQQLIVGRPAEAAFPRLFQFGMRAGMRVWAMGQAWWQGPQGPFWGHNALIRIAAFRAHARLDSEFLSHDQLEAARLHAAGWEVWCLPVEEGSLEANPPALPEFIARDLRWAAGNMQYVRLLTAPGPNAMGRWQMLQAIALFLCAPLWALGFAIALLRAVAGGFDETGFAALAGLALLLWLAAHAPKLAGYAELMLRPERARAYGGRRAVLRGAAAEIVFDAILAPIRVAHVTGFLLARPFGLRIGWGAQNRADRAVGWADATRLLWPHSLIGAALFVPLLLWAPWSLWIALPWAGGLLIAIPFAVLTASPHLSAWLRARGIAATPEERRSISQAS